jgi:hypothetical protein
MLPNMEDMNSVFFLIPGCFFLRYIFEIKVKDLESCRIYAITQSHAENLQTSAIGLLEYCQYPRKKRNKTFI